MKDLLVAPSPMPGWASYSALQSFRACPQRWHYAYLRGLSRSPDISDAKVELNFGIWWHALRAATAIERGRALGSLRLWPREIETPGPRIASSEPQLRSLVFAAAEEWDRAMSEEHAAQWTEKLGERLPGRLEALNRRWNVQWAEANELEDPVGVEVKWVRALPGSEIELLGYVDYIYRDRRRQVLVLRDYKSSKDLATQTSVDDMMDSQVHLYAWGVAPALARLGLKLSAVSYDRARSVKATTPKLNQSGTLSATVTQFDLMSYQEWVAAGQQYPGRAKDGSQAGTYQLDPAMVDKLSSPVWVSRWFQRTMVPLNLNLIRSHLQAASDTIKDMGITAERAAQRGEAPRSLGQACRWCDFAALCRAQMIGGPHGEYHPEEFGLVSK